MGSFTTFYRKHFGGAESATQLYLGFALFLAGFVFCAMGVFIFLAGDLFFAAPSGGGVSQAKIKLSAFLLALGLPQLFFGIQLTLPSRRLIHLVAGLGALACLWGALRFNMVYPSDQWYGTANLEIIRTYTLGLAILVITTGLALMFNYISRHTALPGHELDDIFGDSDREPTMAEILADIEREVSRQNLSWGGVEGASAVVNVLKLKGDFGDDAYVRGGSSGGKVTITSDADDPSEAAYNALMEMRGRRHQSGASDDDTQTAVAALVALRQARQAELERSWWYRFKRWLVNLFVGRGKKPPEHLRLQWKKAKSEEQKNDSAAEKRSSHRNG